MSGLGEFRHLQGLLGHSGHFVRPDGHSGSSGPSGSYGPSGQPGPSGSAGPSGSFGQPGSSGPSGPSVPFTTTLSDYAAWEGNFSKINQRFLTGSLLGFPITKVSEINDLISKPIKRGGLGIVEPPKPPPRNYNAGMANLANISFGNPGNVPFGSQGISGPEIPGPKIPGNIGISGTFGNPGISGTFGNPGISGTFGNPVINSAEEILKVKLAKILNPLADVCLNNKFGLVFADNSESPQIMIDDLGKVLYLYDQDGSSMGKWIVLPEASANKSPESDSDAVKWAEKFSKAVPNMINQANSDVTAGVPASSMVQPDFTPLKKALRIYANKNDQSYTVKLNNNESINYDYVVVQLPKEFQNNTLMLFKEELMV